ncbi:MAG: SOS response-associated peptidase [Candidatus Omnitrophica bacterium]|nr:SOS response-associated peptidase [Candidatus Omnitrophota bacterium]
MCGRYGFAKPKEQVMKRFNIERVPEDLPLLYNIAPQQNAPAILNTFPNEVAMARFGLVPSWSKEEKTSYSMINARAETIMEKQTYKRLIKSKRCLVLSDGFYEWQKKVDKKTPYRIFLKNEEPFAFAGIWDHWGEGENEFYSFSIITTVANKLVAGIHDRMPVILDPEDESVWLQGNTPLDRVLAMLRSYPAEKMDAYPISNLVNSPENNTEEVIKAEGERYVKES